MSKTVLFQTIQALDNIKCKEMLLYAMKYRNH